MASIRSFRFTIGVIAMTIAMLAGGAVSATSASAKTSPTLLVKPATGLSKGTLVKVTGAGFVPKDVVYLVECLVKASSPRQCATGTSKRVRVSATGLLPSTKFRVATGKIGSGTCGTKASNLKSCVIKAANVKGGDSAVAHIAFKSPVVVAPSPKLVVTPATGLKSGDTVKASGTGFTPNDSVYLVECLVTATGEGGCDTATLKAVTITSTGVLPSTTFTVITGSIGNGTCGTTTSDLKNCGVSAGNANGGDSAVAPIVFVAPTGG
jgi:hypothetical protein